MTKVRSLSAAAFVGFSAMVGCGDDQRASDVDGSSGGPGVPPGVGGHTSGGAPSGNGGGPPGTGGDAAATGGDSTTGGFGGAPAHSGGMGGWGGDSAQPNEPVVIPCEPLQELPPQNACPTGPFPEFPLIDEEEELVLCTRSMEVEWAEGPIWDAGEGALLFSNFDEQDVAGLFNGDLMMYRDGEGCSVVFRGVGTNGLAWGPEGTLIAGRHTNRTLSRMDVETGVMCSLADAYEGARFSSPNDLAVRSDGNIYFTDPAWNLGDREQELPQSLYRLAPDGQVSRVAVYDELRPNGVSLSPDESRLYVAVMGRILLFDVDAAGALSGERDFVTGANVDGMAIDCAGNVYASTGHVYSPEGELLGEFWGGTNMAFGGEDGKTLYITGHRRLTSLRVAIPGLPY